MEVAGGWIGKPGGKRRGRVGRKCSRSAVERGDGFVRKIVADQAASGDVAILDGIGVGAGQIQSIVVHLSSGCGFEADAGAGVAAGGAVVGDKVILDQAAGMG